ncbi:hypothetical protein BH23GEM9_BH23GEM9_14260 [soil metagenome]
MTQYKARRVPVLLAAVMMVLLLPQALHAQDVTVRGRVIGPDGAPLAEQRVVLHRVDTQGGATIAEALSGADGGFELNAQVIPDTAAVYFVAARYDEELYIGPPFRPLDGSAMDQLIQVGIPAMSATSMLAGDELPRQVGRPATNRNWLLLLIPLLGVAAVAVYALLPRKSIPRDRTLLIRVAELDERMETAPPAQRTSLLEERQHIMNQLRAD